MKVLQRSFAAGEITPELSGHVDSQEYQTGLELCQNFITLPHGPAMYRPGFLFEQFGFGVTEPARLIPFVPSETDAYLLALVAGKAYVLSGGGLGLITGTVSGPTVYISKDSLTDKIRLQAPTSQPVSSFIYIEDDLAAGSPTKGKWFRTVPDGTGGGNSYYYLDHPSRGRYMVDWGMGGAYGQVTFRNAVELALPYTATDLPGLHFTQSYDVLTIVHRGYRPYLIKNVAGVWSAVEDVIVGKGVITSEPTHGVTVASAGTAATPQRIRAVPWKTFEREELVAVTVNTTNTPIGSFVEATVTVDPADGSLTLAPTTVDATITRVTYHWLVDGVWAQLASLAPGSSTTVVLNRDANRALVAAMGRFAYTDFDPAAVAYHEQRKFFGGFTDANTGVYRSSGVPQQVIGTVTGTERDTSFSLPSGASDAISLTAASLRRNAIEHLVPLTSLLALTGSSCLVLSADGGLATSNFGIRPISLTGANFATPAVTDDTVFYAAARGGHIYGVSYTLEGGGFKVDDYSTLAPHLFEGRTVRDMAVQETPYRILWVVLDNGRLLSMTYDKALKVHAWHQHLLAGTVKHVAVLPGAVEDSLYATVSRPGPKGLFNAIERMAPILEERRTHAVRLDQSFVYQGLPADEISGLDALEGQPVQVVGDGALVEGPGPLGTFQVVNGQVSLPQEAGHVIVGRYYIGAMRSLPITANLQAYGMAHTMNVRSVILRLKNTASVYVGAKAADFDDLRGLPPEYDDIGEPPLLQSGEREIVIDPLWQEEAHIHVVVYDPFPAKILSMAYDLEAVS